MLPFPESRFPPYPTMAPRYARDVDMGRARARSSRVAIAMLARDLGARLEENTRPTTYALGGLFAEMGVFVYENDSQDGTDERLAAWATEDTRVWFRHDAIGRQKWGSVRSPVRGDHMAEYRNVYRDEIERRRHEFDHVIVLDSDVGRISLDGVCHTLGQVGWGGVGSNGLDRRAGGGFFQYDVWAWREADDPRPRTLQEVHPITPGRGGPMVRMASCFGGMAIYTIDAFCGARYAGGDIEHVGLHAGIPRFFFNPNQIVLYPGASQ